MRKRKKFGFGGTGATGRRVDGIWYSKKRVDGTWYSEKCEDGREATEIVWMVHGLRWKECWW